MLQSDLPTWLSWPTVILVGLCFGSFLNVVIYRLPRGINLATPPSTCPNCKTRISPLWNVPVMGWLALRGRSACCKTPISVRYPLVELSGALIAALVHASLLATIPDAPVELFLLYFSARLALGLGLVAAALIDFDYMILPDSLTLGGATLGLLMARFGLLDITLAQSLDGALVGFLVVWLPFIYAHEKVMGFPGMGLGDAKLLMLAGAWFGWLGVLFTLFAGSIQGTLLHVATRLFGVRLREPAAITEERNALKKAIEEAEGEERDRLIQEMEGDPALREIPKGSYGHTRISFGPFLALALLELLLFEAPLRATLLGIVGLE